MKKLLTVAMGLLYTSVSFAQLSQSDKNYMSDLTYIENQKFKNEKIQENIHRQPVLADYFYMAVKNNEIVLKPFSNSLKEEVKSIVDGVKNQLQFDSVNYEDVTKNGQKTVKAHLIYKQKPAWSKSIIFD